MALQRDRRGKWRYRKLIRLPDGRKFRISGTPALNTKQAAEQAERAHILRALSPTPEKKEVPSFREFVEEFKRTYVAANNKLSERLAKESMLRNNLLPAFGSMRLDTITIREVEQFKAALLARKLKPKTVNNNLTVLGRTLRYAAEIGLFESVPRIKFLRVPPAKLDFLDFEEFERLVETARSEPEVRAAILAGGEAGLRAGEIRGLEWDDVDLKTARLTVQRTEYRGHLGSPKGGRARMVPMTRRLVEAFRAIRHLRGPVVFCDTSGARWTRGETDARLWRICRKVGLRKIGWHALRHTFCSHLAMRGASPRAIQELAGHASLATTQRYMHLTSGAIREAISLLERPRRGNSVATESSAQDKTEAVTAT